VELWGHVLNTAMSGITAAVLVVLNLAICSPARSLDRSDLHALGDLLVGLGRSTSDLLITLPCSLFRLKLGMMTTSAAALPGVLS
jgi:hypothetical protein